MMLTFKVQVDATLADIKEEDKNSAVLDSLDSRHFPHKY